MGRTYAARESERSAHTRQLIELLKRKECDVLRYSLDAAYTGYDVLLVRPSGHFSWHMVAVPNGDHISKRMERWLANRDGVVFVSDSITLILNWFGVEA